MAITMVGKPISSTDIEFLWWRKWLKYLFQNAFNQVPKVVVAKL
jgi:hypothetical protein